MRNDTQVKTKVEMPFHQKSNENNEQEKVQNNTACGDKQVSLKNSDSSNSVQFEEIDQLSQRNLKVADSKQQINNLNLFDTEKQIIQGKKNQKKKQVNPKEQKEQILEHQQYGNINSLIENQQKKFNDESKESQKHCQQKKIQSLKKDKQLTKKQVNPEEQKEQILEHQYFGKINSLIKNKQKKSMMDEQKIKSLFQKFNQQIQKLINNRTKTNLKEDQQNSEDKLINIEKIQINDVTEIKTQQL